MSGLYYGLNVDYASPLWEEFGISISHTKLATRVSSAQFWGPILKDIYNLENILIPDGIESVEFPTIAAPRVSMDDVNVFPNVVRIPNSMLKLVDPTDPLLINYLLSIDSTTTMTVLPPRLLKKSQNIRRRNMLRNNPK